MSNFRYGGYLLIAVGLINLRYNTGHPNNFQNSAFIVVPGILLLVATFINATTRLLITPTGKIVSSIVVLSGVLFAAVNT